MKKKIEILCTLGPASLNNRVISRLEDIGVDLFRINLSHTRFEDLKSVVETIRRYSTVPICLDTEGAQIRTGSLASGEVEVKENSVVLLPIRPVPGDARQFNFYPLDIVRSFELGDFISIDFNAVLVQVISKDAGGVSVRVLNGGKIGKNKAVTVERDLALATLTKKDIEALRFGREAGIQHVALSFANRASDVDLLRSHCEPSIFVISKIECRNGLLNLDSIAEKSDALLIDRGDLSRQEPIERIPALQKMIIRHSKKAGKKVYVATNLLESMILAPQPTRAEVNDVINTLIDGADGLVLAAECAIGKNPVGCANMVVKLIHEYERGFDRGLYYPEDSKSLLVEPHGGRLVHRESTEDALQYEGLKKIIVSRDVLMDSEQIALGAYSPLTGFMDKKTLDSVLDDYRLPGGVIWPMPVLFQISKEEKERIQDEKRVLLCNSKGEVHAILDVGEIAPIDFSTVCKKWFGSDSTEHPGVQRFVSAGAFQAAGEVTLLKRFESSFQSYQLTPAQSRFIFTHKGWSRVVGFHTRNVAHRAHEHIQREALELTHADGLYINPVVGAGKPGDFLPDIVLESYQRLFDSGVYPEGKALLGCFLTYPRFSGPREAVFTALCRKNMGCSHFIVGRNHSGVGDYYRQEDYPALFERLGDLGITPLFFDTVGYDPVRKNYRKIENHDKGYEPISGTQVREALKKKNALPDWFMQKPIQDFLRAKIIAKQPVFYE